MHVLIVEDEPFASIHLERTLINIDSTIVVSARLDTVKGTVEWLKENEVDLIFLDIRLADDISFKIFDQVEVLTPIIFTTAYSEYILQVFNQNSIAYLLKPIRKEDLENSLKKYKAITKYHYENLVGLSEANKGRSFTEYKDRFLVTSGGKLKSVQMKEIAYFEADGRYVYLIKHDKRKYIINQKLGELTDELNPKNFFRLNRSFITSFEAIQEIKFIVKGRLAVTLNPLPEREVVISSANTKPFKEWMGK